MARVQQVSAQRLHVLHQHIGRCLAESSSEGGGAVGSEVVLDAQAFISDHLSLEIRRGTLTMR